MHDCLAGVCMIQPNTLYAQHYDAAEVPRKNTSTLTYRPPPHQHLPRPVCICEVSWVAI